MKKKIHNYKINYEMKTIEVKNAFAQKAGVVGSNEYNEFMNLQKEHPTFNVAVIKRAKSSSSKSNTSTIKGVTFELMCECIKKRNDVNFLEEFNTRKNSGEKLLVLKAKFLEHYPEFKYCKTKSDWILAA